MNLLIIESINPGVWYVCRGNHLEYEILRVFYSKDKAIIFKNKKAWESND